MPDYRYGAAIKLDGAPVGLFLDGAYPGMAGEYGYMPVRAIGHYNMSVAVRSGQVPRCSWTYGRQSAVFDVLSIPRYGVIAIGNVVVSDVGVSANKTLHDQG